MMRLLYIIIIIIILIIYNNASLSLLTPEYGNNNNNNQGGSIHYDNSDDVTRIGGLLLIEELELRLGQGNIKLGSILEYISGSTTWGFHGNSDRVGLTMNNNLIFQIINDGVTVFQVKGDANFNDIILNEHDSKDIQHTLCTLTMMMSNKEINEQIANRMCSEKTDVHLSLTKMLRMLGSIQLKTIQMISNIKISDNTNVITSNIAGNGDIVAEVNKAVNELGEHFKLDRDVINNAIEASDRTSKSLTILQNDYVENSEKLKKVIIDMNDGFSRSYKNIEDLNRTLEDDIKVTIVRKFDSELDNVNQKVDLFSNQTIENVLGLVQQLTFLNTTLTSSNNTNMMLYQDLLTSLENTNRTISELANSTKIAIDKSDEISASNLVALTNHFEDEMTYVHTRAASLADNCSHNNNMINQYADHFNITIIKLQNNIVNNMTSLENDMISSLSGLAINMSSVIATSNSIFAKAIGEINNTMLVMDNDVNNRFNDVNSTLSNLHVNINNTANDLNMSLTMISNDIDNRISIKLLDLNDSLINLDSDIRSIIENMVFVLQNDNIYINKSIDILAEYMNNTLDERDTLMSVRLASLNDDFMFNVGNKTEDLANVIEKGLIHVVHQISGVNESISSLNDSINIDLNNHNEAIQLMNDSFSTTIDQIFKRISITHQNISELVNNVSSDTCNNITAINNYVTTFENNHKTDVSKLDNDITNNHQLLTSYLIDVDGKVDSLNTTIANNITNLGIHVNSSIKSLEDSISNNKQEGDTQVSLVHQQLEANFTALALNLTRVETSLLLNISNIQNDVNTRFQDQTHNLTNVITNVNQNLTNVQEFIYEVIYATSSNFTDVHKGISLLQASMVNLADNFVKNDNTTKKLLTSTISELSSITETNTLKLSKEVNHSISSLKEFTNASIVLIRDRLSDLVFGQYNTSVALYDLARDQARDNAIIGTHSEHIKALEDTDNELVDIIAQLHGNATSWKEQNNIINNKQDDDIKSLKTNDIMNIQNINNMTIRLDYLTNDVVKNVKSAIEINSKNGIQVEQDIRLIKEKQEKISTTLLSIEDTVNTMNNKFTEINQKIQILEAYRTSRINDDDEIKKKLITQDEKIQALNNKNDLQNIELKTCQSNSASLEKRIIALEAEALKLRTESVSVSEVDALRKLVNDMQTSMISHSSKVLELIMNSKLSA